MPTTLARIFAATLTMGLAGCESVLIVPANVDIGESRSLLSIADIREIEGLAVAVAPQKGLHSIHATSVDQASVTCGDGYHQNAKMTSFTARRMNGRWIAERSSIETFQPIVLD